MKTFKTWAAVLCANLLLVLVLESCKKEKEKENLLDASKLSSKCEGKGTLMSVNQASSLSGQDLPYTVSLLSRKSNGDGTYSWIYSVNNPKPGNGNNGTAQDLSHWGISLGSCATIKDVVGMATSKDGIKWTSIKPEYKQDKSQDCYSDPILKFDVGTKGSAKMYYKIIVNKNFSSQKRLAVYKSGSRTGCGKFEICGIGCP